MAVRFLLGLILLPGAFIAQPAKAQLNSSDENGRALSAITDELSRKWDSKILLDTALVITAPPRSLRTARTIDESLDYLARSIRGSKWAKFAIADPPPSAARLAAAARALDRQIQTKLLAERPDSGSSVASVRGLTLDSKRESESGISGKPVYILYDTNATQDGRSPAEILADLQKLQNELMDSLPPARRANPMMQWMKALQGHSKDEIEHVMTPLAAAAQPLYRSTPVEDRQGMMEHSMQVMQAYGSALSDSAPQPKRRNYLPELKALAESISRRTATRILIDSAIFVDKPPVAPSSDADLDSTLRGLIKPVRGAVIRRVFHDPKSIEPAPDSLIKDVRALELVSIEAAITGSMGIGTGKGFIQTIRAAAGASLSDKPVYIILSKHGIATESPESLYSALQLKQMESMMHMSASDLTNALGQTLESYAGSDAEGKSRIAASPLMAAMMAIWFPMAAKERQANPPGIL